MIELSSPGKHNELQIAVILEFAPRFAPGSELLYIGDTDNKDLFSDREKIEELGIPLDEHSKLPDVILIDRKRNWLFLIEAVTSHGPVSPKRLFELEEFLSPANAGKVFVTAFPDFKTFKRFTNEIAWETEVWVAENPEHMIHFNGDKFLTPQNFAKN
ncbi:MAG: type II restriction endonuclease [Saprospirales bacterium]|nr:type II restriction endonuclease [Saprospirales bacterium]